METRSRRDAIGGGRRGGVVGRIQKKNKKKEALSPEMEEEREGGFWLHTATETERECEVWALLNLEDEP